MKPALWLTLAASLGLSAWLALQPDAADEASSLVVTPRRGAPSGSTGLGGSGGTAATPNATSTHPGDRAPATRPPTRGQATTRQASTSQDTAPTPALPARAADWPAVSARALLAWGAPPPPVPAATPAVRNPAPPPTPERPRAPAFPYQWIGTLDDGRGAQALLGGSVRGAAVRVGQVLDGQWRVERIREQQLDLVWLPGEQTVTVRGGVLAAGRPARPAPDNDNPEADPEPAS